jgi:hypothetical protein
MARIRADFNPLSSIQTQPSEAKNSDYSNRNFDAVWVFEIAGRKFEQLSSPLQIGVFESQKCYFITCLKGKNLSIYLWRGQDQSILTCYTAFELFLDTKFRYVSNSTKEKVLRSTSALSHTGLKGLTGGKDIAELMDYTAEKQGKEESSLLDLNKLKSTFKPVNQQ